MGFSISPWPTVAMAIGGSARFLAARAGERVAIRDRDVEAIESHRDETVVPDKVDQLLDAELPERSRDGS